MSAAPQQTRARRPLDLTLYLVTDPVLPGPRGLAAVVAAALAGGVTLVQLRDKGAANGLYLETARRLAPLCAAAGVPFLLNDRAHLVESAGADGVHLGREDMPVAEARALIGPDRLLGLSVETPALAAAIDPGLVDYAGIGPFRATATKPGHEPPLGPGGLAAARAACPVPAVAIGGIWEGNAAEAMATGVDGIAVVSALCAAPDPAGAARGLLDIIRANR
jgi:thiamine-phosphate pyrophosphorylase